MTESTLYWVTRLDWINQFLGIFGGGVLMMGIFRTIFAGMDSSFCNNNFIWKPSIIMFSISASLFFLSVFIPTTKEMALIKVLPRIAQSEFIEKTGERADKITDMAFNKLEDILR